MIDCARLLQAIRRPDGGGLPHRAKLWTDALTFWLFGPLLAFILVKAGRENIGRRTVCLAGRTGRLTTRDRPAAADASRRTRAVVKGPGTSLALGPKSDLRIRSCCTRAHTSRHPSPPHMQQHILGRKPRPLVKSPQRSSEPSPAPAQSPPHASAPPAPTPHRFPRSATPEPCTRTAGHRMRGRTPERSGHAAPPRARPSRRPPRQLRAPRRNRCGFPHAQPPTRRIGGRRPPAAGLARRRSP